MPSSSKPLPPNAEDLVFACLESPDPQAALEQLCRERPEDAEAYRQVFSGLARHGLLNSTDRGKETRSTGHPEKLGPYRILEKLGHGGMGVVFLGLDESLGRKVAIKLIRPEQLYVPGNKARFKREVEALLGLSHPGIVRVLGAGEEQGIPYYAMDFVEGLSLADVIRDLGGQPPDSLEGRHMLTMLESIAAQGSSSSGTRLTDDLAGLPWTDLCIRLVAEAAEALQHAHEQQVIHRDVKPSNLLLTSSGHLRLVDFGLARIEDGQSLTGSTTELGSLPYMAPECLGGPVDRLDPRQDVYSLGVTLYELLTLHCPYLGSDPEDTRRRILAAHPPDPRRLNPKVSWDLATVCLTAMDPDPARRYQSCADLLRDLGNLRSRQPIVAQRPKPLLRLRRWGERHPRTSAVLITGSFLLLIATFLYALSETSSRRKFEDLYEKSRNLAYVGNLRAADMDYESFEVADGILRLLRCPEDLRGMEWNLLQKRMDQSLRTLSEGRTPLNDIAISDDGRFLASADRRPGLEILEMPSGKVALDRVLEKEPNRLCFLPKSHLLVLGGLDGTLRIYDVDTRQTVHELVPDALPEAFSVSALLPLPRQGQLAVGYHGGELHLWDLPSRKLLARKKIHESSIQGLEANDEGTLLVSASVDETAALWDLPDLHLRHRVQHASWALGGAIEESGGTFVSCDNLGAVIRTRIDTGENQQLSVGRFKVSVNAVCFTKDRRRFFMGGHALLSQPLADPNRVSKQLGHQATIFALTIDPAQDKIYTASQDGTIREWRAKGRAPVRVIAQARHAVRAVEWMDDQRWVAGDSRGNLLRGRLDDEAAVRRETLEGGRIHDLLRLTPSEFAIATGDGHLSFYRWDGARPFQTLPLASPVLELQRLRQRIVGRCKDGSVLRLEQVDGRWRTVPIELGHPVSTMAGSGLDGSVYWAGEDGVLHRWRPSGEERTVASMEKHRVLRIRPLEQGARIAAQGSDNVIRVLDAATGEILSRLEGHTRAPDSIVMKAGSHRLISAGGFEMKLIIWDPRLQENLLSVRLPAASFDMALSPDGDKLLCGLMWGHVLLCDMAPTDRPLTLTKAARGVEIDHTHPRSR